MRGVSSIKEDLTREGMGKDRGRESGSRQNRGEKRPGTEEKRSRRTAIKTRRKIQGREEAQIPPGDVQIIQGTKKKKGWKCVGVDEGRERNASPRERGRNAD